MIKVMEQSGPWRLHDSAWALDTDALFAALLDRVPMAFQRPVVRRGYFEQVGGYRPECLLWDCDWALRASLAGRCALIETGLYRQRANGQGYYSSRVRALDQMYSNAEMKARLLADAKAHAKAGDIRRAMGKAWMNIAWENLQQGDEKQAWTAWKKSAALHIRLAHFRMLRHFLSF
jgi:hypothetical protein